MPRTMTAEREEQIFGYTYLTKHNMWEVKAELDAEREVSNALVDALEELRLRYRGLFKTHETPSYKYPEDADKDLLLGLKTTDAALAQYAASQPEKEPASEWRPIETAPKDGTRILCYFPDTSGDPELACMASISVAAWQEHSPQIRWEPVDAVNEIWKRSWDTPAFFEAEDGIRTMPTHWMPLPAPPASQPEKEPNEPR
jgi:hypothetical protein